jgi:pimeloyl-ACP methyl ester carboxylesterase
VEDVLAVADHLGITRFHYVGLSLGGMMSQQLAISHPGRVASVTICNSAAKIGTPEG